MRWIKDEEFIRGNIPMTKFNIRALALAHLELGPGDRFLDIGGGTGSISIEAGLQGADVTVIECVDEGVELIARNAEKFGVDLNLIHGKAPMDLDDMTLDKVFIGGSRGELKEIFDYLDRNLREDGILVGNFIMLKNLYEFSSLLKEHDYKNIETHMVQASYMDRIGLMKGENPIYIVKGVK